jgi:hypothetical protein
VTYERPSDEEIAARRAHRAASRQGGRLNNFRRQNTYYLKGIMDDPNARPSVKRDAEQAYEEQMVTRAAQWERTYTSQNPWEEKRYREKGIKVADTPEFYAVWLADQTRSPWRNEEVKYLRIAYEKGYGGRSTSDWKYELLVTFLAKKRLGI